MKHIIELDENDIRGMIADKLSVPTESVSINVSEEWVGYGMSEDKVSVVSCSVTLEEKGGDT